jgi:hypothetical protein
MNDYFLQLNYSPTHLLEMMYAEASCADNYYLSPVNVTRCDVSKKLREELTKIINVPFNDCGFLKTKPLQTYAKHTDKYRITALNMPLFEYTIGFDAYVIDEQSNEPFPIGYKTNYFTLLNVMKPHGVHNNNSDKERIMLSIGIKNHNYFELKEMFSQGKLLNAVL